MSENPSIWRCRARQGTYLPPPAGQCSASPWASASINGPSCASWHGREHGPQAGGLRPRIGCARPLAGPSRSWVLTRVFRRRAQVIVSEPLGAGGSALASSSRARRDASNAALWAGWLRAGTDHAPTHRARRFARLWGMLRRPLFGPQSWSRGSQAFILDSIHI